MRENQRPCWNSTWLSRSIPANNLNSKMKPYNTSLSFSKSTAQLCIRIQGVFCSQYVGSLIAIFIMNTFLIFLSCILQPDIISLTLSFDLILWSFVVIFINLQISFLKDFKTTYTFHQVWNRTTSFETTAISYLQKVINPLFNSKG